MPATDLPADDVPSDGESSRTPPGQPSGSSPRPSARYVQRVRPVRYQAFIATGVVVGLVTATVLALVGTPDGQYAPEAVLGYLAAFLGLLGALAGGAVAVAVESVQRRQLDRDRRRRR